MEVVWCSRQDIPIVVDMEYIYRTQNKVIGYFWRVKVLYCVGKVVRMQGVKEIQPPLSFLFLLLPIIDIGEQVT